jgi:hypothetical protein
MSHNVWPTETDKAESVLALVGSFWAETYAGGDLVSDILLAKAQSHSQTCSDAEEWRRSFSRFTLPVLHNERWSLLRLRKADLQQTNLPRYDGTHSYDGGISYDTPVTPLVYLWPAPVGLVNAPIITNAIHSPTEVLILGIDFLLADGFITFRTNPFEQEGVVEQVFDDGVTTDSVIDLWIHRGEYDWDLPYQQFGYVFNFRADSSVAGLNALNTLYDCTVQGAGRRHVEEFMAAVCGIPIASDNETVRHVLTDSRRQWVITDSNAYGLSLSSEVTVGVGDALLEGDTLSAGLQFHEFNRGELPSSIRAITVDARSLTDGGTGEITFNNSETSLVVSEEEPFTKVTFAVGGSDSDVESFWRTVHERGEIANHTLAMALDVRETPEGQPTSTSLPSTINPAKFLVENFYRGNVFAVTLRPNEFGEGRLPLTTLQFLRRLIPPQSSCLLFVQYETADSVDPTNNDTDVSPSLTEEAETFTAVSATDNVDVSDIAEEVVIYQIRGYCA